MEFLHLGIGLGVLSAIIATLYFLYSRLSQVKTKIEDLNQLITPQAGTGSVAAPNNSAVARPGSTATGPAATGPTATGSAAEGPQVGSSQKSPLHGQIIEPNSQRRNVQISYGSSETSEGTEISANSNVDQSQVILYGQGYAPVPEEVDDVSLNNIDNVSEFPCDLSLARLVDY